MFKVLTLKIVCDIRNVTKCIFKYKQTHHHQGFDCTSVSDEALVEPEPAPSPCFFLDIHTYIYASWDFPLQQKGSRESQLTIQKIFFMTLDKRWPKVITCFGDAEPRQLTRGVVSDGNKEDKKMSQ